MSTGNSTGSGTSAGSKKGIIIGGFFVILVSLILQAGYYFSRVEKNSTGTTNTSQAPTTNKTSRLGTLSEAEAYIPFGVKVDISVSNIPTLPVKIFASQTLRIWGQKGVFIHVKYMGDEKVYVEDTGTYLGPPQGKLYDTVSWSGSGAIPVCVFLRSRPVPDSCKTY